MPPRLPRRRRLVAGVFEQSPINKSKQAQGQHQEPRHQCHAAQQPEKPQAKRLFDLRGGADHAGAKLAQIRMQRLQNGQNLQPDGRPQRRIWPVKHGQHPIHRGQNAPHLGLAPGALHGLAVNGGSVQNRHAAVKYICLAAQMGQIDCLGLMPKRVEQGQVFHLGLRDSPNDAIRA